jgi:hypothetical protein
MPTISSRPAPETGARGTGPPSLKIGRELGDAVADALSRVLPIAVTWQGEGRLGLRARIQRRVIAAIGAGSTPNGILDTTNLGLSPWVERCGPRSRSRRRRTAGSSMSPTPASPPTLMQILRHRAAVADALAVALLRILDETEAIPREAKDRIRESVKSSLRQVAPHLLWRFALHTLNERYLLTLVLVGAAVPILLLVGYPFVRDAGPTGLAAPFAGLLLVVSFLAGMVVGSGLMKVLMSAFRELGGRVVAVAATAALLFLAAGGLGSLLGQGWFVVTVQRGLWASALFFVSFLVIAQGLHLAQVFAWRFTIHRAPGAEVVMELLLTLLAVKPRQGSAGFLALGPTEVVNQLRQFADTIERALPSLFPGLHPVSERWLRHEARSIAAAVDHMSMEMLLGGPQVLATLPSRLGAMLVQVAQGDWMSVARAAPGAAAPSRLPDLRTLAIAAAPLLLGFALRWRILPIEVAPGLVDGLLRFGLAWVLVHALAALDPQVDQKIARTERLLKLVS